MAIQARPFSIAFTVPSLAPGVLATQGFALLPITLVHGLHAGRQVSNGMAHRDPFDRLLAAQAELTGLILVSIDPALQAWIPDRQTGLEIPGDPATISVARASQPSSRLLLFSACV